MLSLGSGVFLYSSLMNQRLLSYTSSYPSSDYVLNLLRRISDQRGGQLKCSSSPQSAVHSPIGITIPIVVGIVIVQYKIILLFPFIFPECELNSRYCNDFIGLQDHWPVLSQKYCDFNTSPHCHYHQFIHAFTLHTSS